MTVIGLEKTCYPVSEKTIGEVEICVTVNGSSVNCPIEFPYFVTLTARDGTAGTYSMYGTMYINEAICVVSFSVAPMDYNQTTPVTMQFHKCNMTKCHRIPIVDDGVLENIETIYVTLEGTADRDKDKMLLEPVNGTIYILDDVDGITLACNCKQVLSIFYDILYCIYMTESRMF